MINNLKYLTIIGAYFFLLNGCSIWTGEREVVRDEQTVSKQQYEQLLKKYEQEVGKKYQQPSSELTDYSLGKVKIDGKEQIDSSKGTLPKDFSKNIDDEQAIEYLEKSVDLLKKNEYVKSMEILQGLESHSSPQIKVRSKFYIGEVLYTQGEYDMALQVYEDFVHNYATSGLILTVLDRLVECSKKLGLEDKEKRYYSILHDFFKS